MKTLYTILVTLILTSISLQANTKGFSHYYSLDSSDSITKSDLSILVFNKLKIIKKSSNNELLFVSFMNTSILSSKLNARVIELESTSTEENKTEKTKKSGSQTPEFGKLFFNFI